jgi:hypothetical protein
MRLRTFQQSRDDLLKLLGIQLGLATGPTCLEPFVTLGLPDLIPMADTHTADVQAAGNLGIREVLVEEFRSLHAPLFITLIAFDNRCVHSTE